MRASDALQRHDFDPIAFIFGLLFTGSGILFMIGRFDIFNHARWLWPGLLVRPRPGRSRRSLTWTRSSRRSARRRSASPAGHPEAARSPGPPAPTPTSWSPWNPPTRTRRTPRSSAASTRRQRRRCCVSGGHRNRRLPVDRTGRGPGNALLRTIEAEMLPGL